MFLFIIRSSERVTRNPHDPQKWCGSPSEWRASACGVKFIKAENSSVCASNRWVDVTAGAPPCLHHRQEIRKIQRIRAPHICCHGQDVLLKIFRVETITPRRVHLSLWIMSIHPSGTVGLYRRSVHYHTSLPVEETSVWNRAKNGLRIKRAWTYALHMWSSSVAFYQKLALKERVMLCDNEDRRGERGGVCSHHCYSNPYTACSMSRVCISWAYVSDWVYGNDCVVPDSHVLRVYWWDKNVCIGVYLNEFICIPVHSCVCVCIPVCACDIPMVWSPNPLIEKMP